MQSYEMYRFTIVAPLVRNDGVASGYDVALRAALLDAGITGWTEYGTDGAWNGRVEPGVLFEIYHVEPTIGRVLGKLARDAMPDQEAIQVTRDRTAAIIWEA